MAYSGKPASVGFGGTGDLTFTAYGLICGGTTATGPLQNVVGLGTATQILTSNGAGALPSWQAAPAGGVTSIAGTANQITASAATGAVTLSTPSTFTAPGSIASTTSLTAGNAFTVTTGAVTITPFNAAGVLYNSAAGVLSTHATLANAVQVGSGGQLADVAVGATGTVLAGNTAAAPTFQTLSGLAATSITGTANQITASASTGAVTLSIPSAFTAPGSITATTTVTATSGNITISSGNLSLPQTTSTVGQINWTGGIRIHGYGSSSASTNLFAGNASGNFTMTNDTAIHNTAIGYTTGQAITTGADNTLIGYQAGTGITTSSRMTALGSGAYASVSTAGTGGVAIGYQAANAANVAVCCIGVQAGLLMTGGSNVILGNTAGSAFTTGARNTLLGQAAGLSLTTSDSDNIMIGSAVNGTAGNNNALIIGSGTGTGASQINSAVICGISGKTTASGINVLVNTSNVLGTTTSSIVYKENVEDIAEHSKLIYQMRPVSFTYKDEFTKGREKNSNDARLRQYGLIAEEVALLDPDLVQYDDQNRPNTIRYHFLPILLLKEIQSLASQVQDLKAEVLLLKSKV